MGIFRRTVLPDDDTLMRWATEALTHPPDSAFSDPDLFVDWGLTVSMSRDSDILETSNFARISEDMFKVFPGDVKSQMSSHWAVGWVDQLEVRVIEPWADPYDYTVRDITRAFAVITSIALSLARDYPVYDDSDYAEREYEEELKNKAGNWDDVVHELWMTYDVDDTTVADRASFDEFWRDSWDSTDEPWVEPGEAAEKILFRRWAGFTTENAEAW